MPEAIGDTVTGRGTGGGAFAEEGTVESRGNTGDDDEDSVVEEEYEEKEDEEEEEMENEEEEGEVIFTATFDVDSSDTVSSSTALTFEAVSSSTFTTSFSFWLKSGS